jgi:hypothetical protein
MKIWRKSAILAVALLAFGALRMPFEAALSREIREAGLFPPRLAIDTRERIGQTSSAVALGGLRTLVATFLNLRAFTFFTEKKWADVGKTFDLIVDLAPRTRYYWETGSWHQAYNAASYYLNDSELPPLRRKESWRSSIFAGRVFLERGIRNNPDDWSLLANLGFLLTDSNKFPAFRDADECFAVAADAYRRAAETGKALGYVRRAHLYALARVSGRETEALELARSLYAAGEQNHTPTLLILLLVLEAWENPDLDTAARAIELFGTPEKAYDALSGHWMRTRERFPVHGVARAIEVLEKQLNLPAGKSVFDQPPPAPFDPDELFKSK